MSSTARQSAQSISSPDSASDADASRQNGLTSEEAGLRLKKFGPNAMPDTAVQPMRMALGKFWAPVPWMLEAAIILELVLGKYVEAGIITGLLVFNASLGLFQERAAPRRRWPLSSRGWRSTRQCDATVCGKPFPWQNWCRAMR